MKNCERDPRRNWTTSDLDNHFWRYVDPGTPEMSGTVCLIPKGSFQISSAQISIISLLNFPETREIRVENGIEKNLVKKGSGTLMKGKKCLVCQEKESLYKTVCCALL